MGRQELTRVEVMARVKAGTLSVDAAVGMMGASYRQAKRPFSWDHPWCGQEGHDSNSKVALWPAMND
jgi:hypothetical protein